MLITSQKLNAKRYSIVTHAEGGIQETGTPYNVNKDSAYFSFGRNGEDGRRYRVSLTHDEARRIAVMYIAAGGKV